MRNWNVRRFVVVLGVICATGILAIVVLLSPRVGHSIYDRLIFWPIAYPTGSYDKLEAYGIKPEEVYIDSSSGFKIHGLYYADPVKKPKYVLLYSHGNGQNVSTRIWLVDKYLRKNVAVFIYDYAGYGRSTGKPSLDGIYKDGVSAYEYLIDKKHFSGKNIILYGESLGTTVTGKLASNYESAATILECPLKSLRRVGSDKFEFLRNYPDFAWSDAALALDNGKALAKKHSPLLMVAGTTDHLTQIKQADELFAEASEPKTYIRVEGQGHTHAIKTSAAYRKALDKLFASLN